MAGDRRRKAGGGRRQPSRRARGRRESATLDPDRVRGLLAAARRPLSARYLAKQLGIPGTGLRELRRLLARLEASGGVERHRGGWRLSREDGLVEALVDRDARGLSDDAGRRWSLDATEGVRSGDRVLAQPLGENAEVLEILEGRRDRWVGIVESRRRKRWLVPYRDDARWALRIEPGHEIGVRPGDVVVAVGVGRASRKGRGRAVPRVRVVERLGRPGDALADFEAVRWRHRLPRGFPEPVLSQAAALPEEVSDAEREQRRDLRDLGFVTIDPADARDHDDALRVERRSEGGWRLQVAIADVAHWVPVGSPLDREAYLRGNSVYFPERVIPMLPERLSSELCSLVPERDRLAVGGELDFDARARQLGCRVYEAVIRSRERFVYEEAASLLDGRETGHPLAAMLVSLGALSRALYRRRRSHSIDFDLPEPAFRWGGDGVPIDVQPASRTSAHRAVEEAMLAANRAVADLLLEAGIPAVHRVHEAPAPEDEAKLWSLLDALDLLPAEGPVALDGPGLSAVLGRSRGHFAETALPRMMLRAMRQARYAPDGRGHFALGFPDYLHFTSPIRRYADLSVHRSLKGLLGRGEDAPSSEDCARIATRASHRERLGLAAERERVHLAQCAFLSRHLGDRVMGSIRGISRHGFYVACDPWLVEGLVHVSRLPGFLAPDPLGLALVSKGNGERYALGDRVRVRVESVDPVRGRISFALEAHSPSEGF